MALALPANGLRGAADDIVTRVLDRGAGPARQAPFLWQDGPVALLIDAGTPARWVVAELTYYAGRGYVETFRAAYASPREAMSSLLARSLVTGDEAMRAAAAGLDAWYGERNG
jgi:hypothetical protein